MDKIGISTESKTPIFWFNGAFLDEIIVFFTLVTAYGN